MISEVTTHVDSVGSLLGESSDSSHGSRVEHDLVVINQRVLIDPTKDVSAGDVIADLRGPQIAHTCDLLVRGRAKSGIINIDGFS